ncbi:Haloacid dehalogenase-like hydrolase [Cordyceps militaris]|uniref:Haloacid dehalogenase-like hydrolase n=1 Tax=Cordyceps militaris TaxID=73501 RepID=A0A2H4S9L6_CORMI|nr:Haloacid dehalogenase-like hydrolase [Cordyceps militaris]
MARPVFLIRDPIRVFDSWKHVGCTDAQSLIEGFTNMFRMLDQVPSHANSCLLYERLVQQPQNEVQRICSWWGVPFSETMLDFKKPFEASFIFSNNCEEHIFCKENSSGLFTTVEAASSVLPDVPPHSLLSNDEKNTVEEHLGRLYLRCWQDEVPRLRNILLEKTWIGFDLDDTLHEFRQAASTATDKVLAEISRLHNIPMPALKQEYSKVLQLKTANAFSDGKTSFDYRRERFTLVLEHFSLPYDAHFITWLLETYEATLSESLELKCGALGLLSAVKKIGKKIVVITEGPQDAQERTIEALGISSYIDFLATTNSFGVSKTGGLFSKVLQHLGISSDDMVYIGDSVQRDMEPALRAGIFSIHFAESKNVLLNSVPPQINTLRKLQYILTG